MNTKSLEVFKCYFSFLILKLHIICVLTWLINQWVAHPASNEAVAYARSKLHCGEVSSHFVHLRWKYTNGGFLVCHLDECPGLFHRVQMWRNWDPSWFQKSIGVHEGRVNVYLLPWHDTESAQKERHTWCVCACVCALTFTTTYLYYQNPHSTQVGPFCWALQFQKNCLTVMT